MHLAQTGVIKTNKIQVVHVDRLRDIENAVGDTGDVFHVFVGNHGSMLRVVV